MWPVISLKCGRDRFAIKSKSAKPKGYSMKIEKKLESYFLFFK